MLIRKTYLMQVLLIVLLIALSIPTTSVRADEPETLVIASPWDMAVGGGHVVWTVLQGEFCSPKGTVKSLSLSTRTVNILVESCDAQPAEIIADDAYAYYADWRSDTIQRIPVGGGTPSTLASAKGLIYHRVLNQDNTHVYFVDDEGVKRVSKASGSVDTLVDGAFQVFIEDLAVDSLYIYWTEQDARGGADNRLIKRVPQTGGSVEILLSGSDLGDSQSIAVDDANIYWTEASGKVRSMPKAGGAIADLVGDNELFQPHTIAANNASVYWLEDSRSSDPDRRDGRLRRFSKDSGSVEDLALGLAIPFRLQLSASHIYWSEKDAIKRLPINAREERVDLTITNVELTQGIQNLDPALADVPLVAEKTTFVRVYPAVTPTNTSATAQLRGFRGGVELPGSPLRPTRPLVYVRSTGADRALLSDTFNFWLPPAWRSGSVNFRAEINPGGTIAESDSDNNIVSQTVAFTAKPPVCAVMIPVRTHAPLPSTQQAGFWDMIERAKSLWPVADVWVYEQSQSIEELQARFGIPPWEYGPYELPEDKKKIIASLVTRDVFTDDPDECDDLNAQTHYVGMVHPKTNTGTLGGYGTYDWAASLFFKMTTEPDGTAYSSPSGGTTLAHELAHNQDRRHIACGNPDDVDSNYPYPPCQIDHAGPNRHWGFDPISQSIIQPTAASDFMTYGSPRWVSDYTWRALFNRLGSPGSLQAHAAEPLLMNDLAQTEEVLFVTGVITPSSATASLDSLYRLPQGQIGPQKLRKLAERQQVLLQENGAYSLNLLNASGEVLAAYPFDPAPPNPEDDLDSRQFVLTVPFVPGTTSVALFEAEVEKIRQRVSTHAPQVNIRTPSGGTVVADQLSVAWEASDADGEPLFFTVQYSADQGQTWRTLATDYPYTTLTLSTIYGLPGSNQQALVRVIANDGINTGSATSEPFSVRFHAPVVHIKQPSHLAVFEPGSQIVLMGGALDAEDGTLDDAALRWFVDGRLVGSGKDIALEGLEQGIYVITLQAVDDDNNTAATSRIILVGNARLLYLPVIRR